MNPIQSKSIEERIQSNKDFINSESDLYKVVQKGVGIIGALVIGSFPRDLGCNWIVTAFVAYEAYAITSNLVLPDSLANPLDGTICQIAFKWLSSRNKKAELPLPATLKDN